MEKRFERKIMEKSDEKFGRKIWIIYRYWYDSLKIQKKSRKITWNSIWLKLTYANAIWCHKFIFFMSRNFQRIFESKTLFCRQQNWFIKSKAPHSYFKSSHFFVCFPPLSTQIKQQKVIILVFKFHPPISNFSSRQPRNRINVYVLVNFTDVDELFDLVMSRKK